MSESFPRRSARTRRFSLGEPRSVTICRGGQRVLFLRAASGTDARTGLWCLDLDGAPTERLVVDPTVAPGEDDLPAEERARRERVRETATGVVSYSVDSGGTVAVFALGGRLHRVDVETGEVTALPVAGPVFDPRVDPTGRRVAYVGGDALRVCAIDGSDDATVAGGEGAAVSWGRAEHVAAEEMGRHRGFWWAPDGGSLLATRVDESPVPTWWIADPAHPDRPPQQLRYPAAGSEDALVTLHHVVPGQSPRPISWDSEKLPYLARVGWSHGRAPLLAVQSRDQRTVQVLEVDLESATTSLLAEDGDPIWVELFDGVPAWFGERLVRVVDRDGRRLVVGDEAVTPADVYVRDVVSVEDTGIVFTASFGDPTRIDVVRWAPAGLERLTDGSGVHGATASDGTVVVASASLAHDGTRHVVRHRGHEVVLRSIAERPGLEPDVRMLTLGPRRLRAGLVLPRDHTPGRRLPVLVDPYAGPHVQRVLASRRGWLEPQWLADQGFAVLVTDGRGTPGRDPDWEREIHHDLAGPVLDDQVDALLAAAEVSPDLDLSRVGIRGWSFGGFLAALAVLRRPDVFHAAVAGAPVIDWSLYDTHYTERYLGRPQDEPEVYRRNSLLDDAASLRRPLLLIHGLADDNVVAAHTVLLSQRLTENGRPHSVVPLTGVTHMTPQETVAENLLMLQVQFLKASLGD